jgi:hypothetical protein
MGLWSTSLAAAHPIPTAKAGRSCSATCRWAPSTSAQASRKTSRSGPGSADSIPSLTTVIRADGIAATLDEARTAFEAAWAIILPQCTAEDFAEHREQRAFVAWRYRMWDAGCRIPTQTVSGMSKCYCGALINSRTSLAHVRARHMEGTA